jgi:hypothetical protein
VLRVESGELVAARCVGVLGAQGGGELGRCEARWALGRERAGRAEWAARERVGGERKRKLAACCCVGVSCGRRGGELELAGGSRAAEWRKETARVWRSVAELEASSGAGRAARARLCGGRWCGSVGEVGVGAGAGRGPKARRS